MYRFAFLTLLLATPAWADGPANEGTIAYVTQLQVKGGGFLNSAPEPGGKAIPTLKATSAAVRALHYLGGKVPNSVECAKFVESCYDAQTGGFSDQPRGKPDLFCTAVGIMAVTQLKMPTEPYAQGVIRFLSENAKSDEDIRIAAAGLERLSASSTKKDAWLAQIRKLQNPDGTFGKGLTQARETGGRTVILLRFGVPVPEREKILAVLKEGQRPSGGFGKTENELETDLETSYRILRCFVMLKDRPNRMEGLRTYIAKCRNPDNGYGISPGEPSTVGATYFASILNHWLDQPK